MRFQPNAKDRMHERRCRVFKKYSDGEERRWLGYGLLLKDRGSTSQALCWTLEKSNRLDPQKIPGSPNLGKNPPALRTEVQMGF